MLGQSFPSTKLIRCFLRSRNDDVLWWENIKGIHESSGKALRIMQITTVMVADPGDLVSLDHPAARPCKSSAGAAPT